jgi:hypothetical protein
MRVVWALKSSLRHFRSVLNLSRSEVDKTSPLLLQSFDFSTLYTKIDLMDLKAHMKVLINKVFHWMLKLHCFKFLLVQRSALKFRFLWLKNKEEINLFENLHSFEVVEASDLISWSVFLLENCFFLLVIVLMDNVLVSPWVPIVWSIWLISISFPMSLIS